jgi:carbon starvation protein
MSFYFSQFSIPFHDQIQISFLADSSCRLFMLYYASFIAKKIYSLDEFTGSVPAKEFEDGIDFVPTSKGILLGHHFTSIAGAAPIIGPCIAAYWGWLPAFLWIVFGAIFIGGIHDFGALVISVREKGNTIANITGIIINDKVKAIFLFFVMMLSWLVMAVFSMAIAGLFVTMPTAVLPINIEIVIAIFVGILLYKKKKSNYHICYRACSPISFYLCWVFYTIFIRELWS